MSRRGLITGWPGWLTDQFLRTLSTPAQADPPRWATALSDVRWRCLCLPGSAPEALAPGVDEILEGDIRDPRAAARALRDVDVVVHAAGLIHPRRIRELYEINRDGCRVLARGAVEAGVRRFVFVSSNAAAGFAAGPDRPMRESDPPSPGSHYGRSKLEGEQALWETVAGTDTEGVALRPVTFYGPGFPARHLKAYRMAASGRPLLIGRGRNRVSMVFIDELVDALGRSLVADGAAGETFFLADADSYEWREVFLAMGRAQGVEARPLSLPGVIAPLCAAADGVLSALGRYHMMIHVAGEATRHMGCDVTRARERLGFAPAVGLYEGMRRAVDWARAEGVL